MLREIIIVRFFFLLDMYINMYKYIDNNFYIAKSEINFFTRCLTGSYDRTCKVWDIDSGAELLTLEGHKNVVYTVSFNNPISYVSLKHYS